MFYTYSSRLKIASKIKANIVIHKSRNKFKEIESDLI